ncbi:hypothetical protein [Spirosoma foliorum]|uniref:VRR-NUC domain-containing protein n=1 Tax=Spirosoma foliorum TaxID=2710596 RepID=A0A7G5GUD3_9BACT|nr:hypothetical protein [Spirosoma foliorum]QMW02475.1 hypothetical protein H3H32_31965 [Spirosoma foliorum]
MSTALTYLASLEMAEKRRKHPNVPDRFRVQSKFVVKDANNLTQAVKRCLELHDCYVTRVQSQGQWNQSLGRFTRSTTTKGTADLHAVVEGRHVSIEIKWGKDKLSAAQQKTADQVNAAGGLYLVVKDYDTFWSWFNEYAPDLIRKIGGEPV